MEKRLACVGEVAFSKA
ncbi:hypothetical protein Gohar_019048 [Gossypium harknessii]|uniref:Uncharacterized protein n=1 Tax=Gossypium harknessii TaxID=34285 RepID=A0A7J9GAZ7_9ROSI|nr:hypothetical protein [Gossypium harknessii]